MQDRVRIPWRWWSIIAGTAYLGWLAITVAFFFVNEDAMKCLGYIWLFLFSVSVPGTMIIEAAHGFDRSPILANVFHLYDNE